MNQHDNYYTALKSLDHLSHPFLVKHYSIIIMVIMVSSRPASISLSNCEIIINFIVINANHTDQQHHLVQAIHTQGMGLHHVLIIMIIINMIIILIIFM